jgi:hypothetical protein
MTPEMPATAGPVEDEPHGVHIVDKRGITAPGAVTVALAAGLLGGAFDVVTGRGLRVVFSVLFVAGCAFAAARVHREDLGAAVTIPPLAYLALLAMGGLFDASGVGGSTLNRELGQLVNAMILKFPVLFVATLSAATIALVRWWHFHVYDVRRPRAGTAGSPSSTPH